MADSGICGPQLFRRSEWSHFYIGPFVCHRFRRRPLAIVFLIGACKTTNTHSITHILGEYLQQVALYTFDGMINSFVPSSMQCVISIIMLLTADILLLINYFSQILWLSVVASIAALLWMRKTMYDSFFI